MDIVAKDLLVGGAFIVLVLAIRSIGLLAVRKPLEARRDAERSGSNGQRGQNARGAGMGVEGIKFFAELISLSIAYVICTAFRHGFSKSFESICEAYGVEPNRVDGTLALLAVVGVPVSMIVTVIRYCRWEKDTLASRIRETAHGSKETRSPQPARVSPVAVANICYGMAYDLLPSLAFDDFEAFRALWRDRGIDPMPALFRMACKHFSVSEDLADQVPISSSIGSLSPSADFYLVQFPEPPRFDFSKFPTGELYKLREIPFLQRPVLAPHFAALVHDKARQRLLYYVLGQSEDSSTSLRAVQADRSQLNLGRGSEATVLGFLQLLRRVSNIEEAG